MIRHYAKSSNINDNSIGVNCLMTKVDCVVFKIPVWILHWIFKNAVLLFIFCCLCGNWMSVHNTYQFYRKNVIWSLAVWYLNFFFQCSFFKVGIGFHPLWTARHWIIVDWGHYVLDGLTNNFFLLLWKP